MQKIIYSLIIASIISIGAVSLNENIENDLSKNIIRLHIVADSDLPNAQAVKLKVRDAVLENVSADDENFPKKAEIEANRVLEENGETYSARAYCGRFFFPAKQYKNITLPRGIYTGIRLVLGSGSGKNWWCIMYPPLCAVTETEMELEKKSAKILERVLTPQSYELVTSSGDKIKIRFKTVEILEKIKTLLR